MQEFFSKNKRKGFYMDEHTMLLSFKPLFQLQSYRKRKEEETSVWGNESKKSWKQKKMEDSLFHNF